MKNLITCLSVCVLSGVAFADTWTVDDDGKADFDNIQAAVDGSSDGDEIVVMPGTYTSTQDGHVVNMLGKAVTLHSSDPSDPDVVATTIIDGENTRRGIACFNNETSNTIISGFTITNGFSVDFDYNGNGGIDFWEDNGGGMCNLFDSNPILTNCRFISNTSGVGGGTYNIQSDPIYENCTFEKNFADQGAGMVNYQSNSTLNNCMFMGNTGGANFGGGGMYNYASNNLTLAGCSFISNTADDGGGMYNYNASPTLTDCIFTNNTADDGGGMYNYDTSNPTLANCTLCSNTPNQIHGLWSDEGGNNVSAICTIPGACCTNDHCLVSEEEDCLAFFGQWLGNSTTCEDNPCPTICAEDVTGDGLIDVSDLLAIIGVWGACP